MDGDSFLRITEIFGKLLPGNTSEIHSLADLTGNPDPDIRELCETAELMSRLSRGRHPMKKESQYDSDITRLTELISKFTGISKIRAAAFFAEYGVSELFRCPYAFVKSEEQAQKLELMLEFMRLYVNLSIDEKKHVLNSTESAREYFIKFYIDKLNKEYFSIAFQDAQSRIIKSKVLSIGSVREAVIYPREVIKEALFTDSVSVTLSHNHPACTEYPTEADMIATKELVKSLNAVDIYVNDHILVVGSKAISFAELGIDLGLKNRLFKVTDIDKQAQERIMKKKPAKTEYCR